MMKKMFNDIKKLFEPAHPSVYQQAVHNVFNTKDGEIILSQYIKEDYTSPFSPERLNAEALAYEEGRRSIIRDFIAIRDMVEARAETERQKQMEKIAKQAKEKR